MDIDQFWSLIDQARAAAGPEADQAVRDYDDIDSDPDRDYWDVGELLAEDRITRLAAMMDGSDDAADADDDDLGDEDDEDDITDPVALALHALLSQLPAAEIGEFDNLFEDVRSSAATPALGVAAQLIEHGFIAADSFDDFRAGLVALGRKVFEAAVADPDSLAEHPLVREIAAANDPRWLGREDMMFVASYAYTAVTGEPQITFYDFAEGLRESAPDTDEDQDDRPDEWDISDEAETRRRLPRLTEMFYARSTRNRQRVADRLDELGLQG